MTLKRFHFLNIKKIMEEEEAFLTRNSRAAPP